MEEYSAIKRKEVCLLQHRGPLNTLCTGEGEKPGMGSHNA